MSSQITSNSKQTSSCQAVQQFNPNTGFLDPQIYYPVYHPVYHAWMYYIEPFGWCPAYQNEWNHQYYASSPLLPDSEVKALAKREYSAKQILELYKKSLSTHSRWKDQEQKHGNPIPNGAWGRFRLEADKIFRNCTVPRTKKLPRVRSHRELIDYMQRLYKEDGSDRRPQITEKLPTHHGVVYDKWKSNKDRRDAMDAEKNSMIVGEGEYQKAAGNYEKVDRREKVVICDDCDVTLQSEIEASENQVCEGGEGKENEENLPSQSEPILKTENKKPEARKSTSPRKPFGIKN